LVKPYQPSPNYVCSPPLGLLSIVSCLRERFGEQIELRYLDAKVRRLAPSEFTEHLAWADVIGVSALNFEAKVSVEIAAIAKALDAAKITVLGGPYAHRRAPEILAAHREIDWVFDGESEYTFPEAIARLIDGAALAGIKGLFFRDPVTGAIVAPLENDFITDLDRLPIPAWDLVEFDRYARQPNMNAWMKGKRYAVLFTSRGCPYKCAYCHDIFTKKFRWMSAERVLAEIELLTTLYGVDEFQIVDDIFNLHKPRVRAIFGGVVERYGKGKLHFCFPNGLRGDILDREVVHDIKNGGGYQVTLAVETVTPRLQGLIQKNLDIERVANFIRYCHDEGIIVKGFFMLGFPTESREELWNTIRFAWNSKLSFASFFTVVPQPGTPLHALARRENEEALLKLSDASYYDSKPWYSLAYDYPLGLATNLAYLGFYFAPLRLLRLARLLPLAALWSGFWQFVSILASSDLGATKTRLRLSAKGHSTASVRTNRRYSD
jgi:radical SAM superfamily enzyme YgiQ (UPF0313 family)